MRKIEEQYRTSAVHRESAAKLIGYTSLSGPANKALAALAAYGLVERAGKGEMRVTNRAQDILYSDGNERLASLQASAFEPPLFRELQERWPNMTPPEDGVVMHLNRQGFNQNAVRPAARAYLDTLAFLEESGASESHGGGHPTSAESPQSDNHQPEENSLKTTLLAKPTTSVAIGYANEEGALNRVNMNIQGDKVHLSGLLDLKGLAALEKKIKALKVLLNAQTEDAEDEEGTEDPLLK